jgi:hypothetical protein
MSFSFDFNARSRKHALELLERQTHIPEPVRSFVKTAIENMSPPTEDIQRIIMVRANGHLCDGPQWSSSSSLNIEVKPVVVSG